MNRSWIGGTALALLFLLGCVAMGEHLGACHTVDGNDEVHCCVMCCVVHTNVMLTAKPEIVVWPVSQKVIWDCVPCVPSTFVADIFHPPRLTR